MREQEKGFTVWIMGLASSGKSTLARLVEKRLLELGLPVVLLEPTSNGELKSRLMPDLNFDRSGKNEMTRRLGFVARLITHCGGVAVVPWITPERLPLEQIREEIGSFVEIFVDCPIGICKERDDRGIYQRAVTEGHPVPGVTEPWEPPSNPDLTVDSTKQSPGQELSLVIKRLEELGYLKS
ncbi:MAG: adenylyl-sulfate kinase [Deltaproteobacteria bacterium]|nr:adenylyl-sulfate kinase [Deltaproteobacteria bacterium]